MKWRRRQTGRRAVSPQRVRSIARRRPWPLAASVRQSDSQRFPTWRITRRETLDGCFIDLVGFRHRVVGNQFVWICHWLSRYETVTRGDNQMSTPEFGASSSTTVAVDPAMAWHRRCNVCSSPPIESPCGGSTMSAAAVIGILVALIVVGVAAWYVVMQRRRTQDLQARYGPEYTRTVNQVGDQRRAEHELEKRQERVEHLEIQPLSAEQRGRFTQQWRNVQAMFVDDPRGAVTRADGLVEEVMKTRGYPVSDFDQRAADLSVHHGRVVENYRA